MAEKKSKIKQKDFNKGYYIELNCPYCYKEEIVGGRTKQDLSTELKNREWKWLDSDYYAQSGYWCGCDYKD